MNSNDVFDEVVSKSYTFLWPPKVQVTQTPQTIYGYAGGTLGYVAAISHQITGISECSPCRSPAKGQSG
jgi:hypothetical protein